MPNASLTDRAAELIAALAPNADPSDLNFRGAEFAAIVHELAEKAAAMAVLETAHAFKREGGGWLVYLPATSSPLSRSLPYFGLTLQQAANNVSLATARGVGYRPNGSVR